MRKMLIASIFVVIIAAFGYGRAAADEGDQGDQGNDEIYKITLVPCTVDLCGAAGTATLGNGKIEVNGSGDVNIEMEGSSLVSSTLSVSFQTIGAVGAIGTALPVGTLTTDEAGAGEGEAIGTITASSVMGLFYVSDANGTMQYVSGFSTGTGDITTTCTGDDDCDGVSNEQDSTPGSANMFDGTTSKAALAAAYVSKVKAETSRTKAEIARLQSNMKKSLAKIKGDFNAKKSDPTLP